jgi:DNA-binding NarL/FixJ family response regulator
VKPLDFIGAIELAYDRSTDEEAWLANITKTIAPAFSPGPPTTSFFFNLIEEDAKLGTTASVAAQKADHHRLHTRADYQRLHDEGKAIDRPPRLAYECDMFTVLSRVIGAEDAAKMLRAAGMPAEDALGLRANMTAESGVIFTTHVAPGFRIRNRNLWTRFAAHLGSALRLRRLHDVLNPESAVAVLSPNGRLEHAEAEAAASARGDLAEAAKAMDRARGKLRRLDPENASALWRAMVVGQWSLVDWFDHDGKRFLLAQENTIPASNVGGETSGKSLTEREHQVVACAAMGHSNKLIAYDLGLSTGTVSVLLARAGRKLGVSGRVALIRAYREQTARLLAPE